MNRLVITAALVYAASSGIALAKDVTVSQKGKAFSTDQVSLSVGDSIVFQNEDQTSHSVFSTSDTQKFNVGIQKPGASIPVKFDKPGVVSVRCAIHPNMKLQVTVK